MIKSTVLSALIGLALVSPAHAMTNILVNPGFEDTDAVPDGQFGDGWGAWGAASFNDFWSGNGHASLYPDTVGNIGGVYQLAIPGTAGTTYQFDLLDTRIEASFDASLRFGLEYYAADDATKLGETIVEIDAATRLGLSNVGGDGAVNAAVFSMQGTAVVGTVYVRPVISFDDVNPAYIQQSQANVFVFDSYMAEVPAAGGELAKNPGFDDENGDGNLGDRWGAYGNTGFNAFFGDNPHASFFADYVGNSGGIYQQAMLGTPGTEYTFELTNVRIEDNWDADLLFGFEFYGDDDFTKIGELLVTADTSVTGDGLFFEMSATAVAGTKYIRPVILFDNVNPAYIGESQANLFIFTTSVSETVNALPGDLNGDGFVGLDDLDIILSAWNQNVPPANSAADPSGDGFVGLDDLDIVLNHWNEGTPPASVVPEPGTLALLGLMGAAGLRRRS